MGTTAFPSYSSSTMQSSIGEIGEADSAKLCLSCHDGTIALASTVRNGDIEFVQGPDYKLPPESPSQLVGYGGTGFVNDHPFAFTPNTQNPEIRIPKLGDAVRLEVGKLQCVSCHDPHRENTDTTQGNFLVKVNRASALCLTCHNKTGWSGSAHQAPPDPIQDQRYTSAQGAHTGYVGVANNGCESCHRPHTAGSSQRLIKFVDEDTCYRCHDGSVTALNIKSEFMVKTYRHPVDVTPSTHDASEAPANARYPLPETSASAPRHAECEDCHNPHATRPTSAAFQPLPPTITPPLTGTSGMSSSRAPLKQVANEYEVCFKCHADSANRPQLADISTAGVGFGRNAKRQFDVGNPQAYNTRVEFTEGASFHPVTRTNPAASTASLRGYMITAEGTDITNRGQLNLSSMIYCSDCHASNTSRTVGAGNSGPTGTHGSDIQHLLERNHRIQIPPVVAGEGPESDGVFQPSDYTLCNKCHDLQGAINTETGPFRYHQKHLEKGAACSTCHDPHASQSPRLINFDLAIVGPSSTGPAQYLQTSPGHGTCTLKCHSKDHTNWTY